VKRHFRPDCYIAGSGELGRVGGLRVIDLNRVFQLENLREKDRIMDAVERGEYTPGIRARGPQIYDESVEAYCCLAIDAEAGRSYCERIGERAREVLGSMGIRARGPRAGDGERDV
jgi:hypothetical protein